MSKSTKVTVRANGGTWMVNANGSAYKQIGGSETFTCTDSKSGDVDVSGEFYNDNIIIQFEMNNPWIGSPWAAVGQAMGDSGWDNDRTSMDEGDSHVFSTTIYNDDDEYTFNTRVLRLSDTDTKNFEVWPGWYE
jgi:hypothetical protein